MRNTVMELQKKTNEKRVFGDNSSTIKCPTPKCKNVKKVGFLLNA